MMRADAHRRPTLPRTAQPHRSISRAIRAAKSARIHHRSVHVRNGAFSTQQLQLKSGLWRQATTSVCGSTSPTRRVL